VIHRRRKEQLFN